MGFHRRPRTTQERRETGKREFIDFEGYKVKIRPSRNLTNLPEAWDDITPSTYGHRSWKRHRKTQWKVQK